MNFRILGPVQVHLEAGQRALVPRGRVLSFLSLLLVHRDATLHVDRIVDELWGGADLRNAKNAVQVVASRLRAAVGDGALVSEGGGYALRVPRGSVDADRFEDGRLRGAEELARGEPWQAAETLREALGLWRGPPLVDVGEDGFAQPEIARLDDLRLTCLSERVDADGQLMLALYRAGRQAEALAEYRAARRALVDDLGLEPSSELRALERAILCHELDPPLARCSSATTVRAA